MTLMFPDRDREYQDYQDSLDEPSEEEYAYQARRNREAIRKKLAQMKQNESITKNK